MHAAATQPFSIREVPEALTPRAEDTFIRGYRQLALETPARPRDVVLRSLDVLLSSLFLLLALPLALPITLIVLLTSGRPVFYRGERVGRGGRVFTMLKFRTLRADAETRLGPFLGEELVKRTEGEFTTIGKWLKATQLDELPQFLNVLRGDMSLVGPRPPIASEVKRYDLSHLRRLDVLPGMTGLWQVQARQDPSFDSYISLDTAYIQNWSIWLDLKILIRTLSVVVGGTGS